MSKPLFKKGKYVTSKGIRDYVMHWRSNRREIAGILERHLYGDWGCVDDHAKSRNDWAVTNGAAILSKYQLKNGYYAYIKTEWNRARTTVMMEWEL